MCNKIILSILIFFSLLLLISCVCATDNSADTVGNENVDQIKVDSKAGVDLDNLINGNESGDKILLNDDYVFNLSKDYVISGIKINRSLTIDGQGHTVNGINIYRIFDIAADNVVLKNIRFVNSSFYLDSFNAVQCKNSNGVCIINCTFINCGDSYSSGAISFENSSSASIINSTFIGNNGWHGGAVYFEESYGFIMNSTFIDNSGTYGGAVYFGINSTAIIMNSTFIENNYTRNFYQVGGAIMFTGDNITVDDCIFINNKAFDGGAIGYSGKKGSFTNSLFINNHGHQFGGSISCDGRRLSIVNCTFNNSSVKFYGGAIYYSRCYRNIVDNSTFIGNNATYGGSIYFRDRFNKAIVKNSIFKENYAEYGAAINAYNQTSKNAVMNSIFIKNKAKHNGTINGVNVQNCTIIKIQSQLSCQPIATFYNEGKYLVVTLKDSDGVILSNVSVKLECGSIVKSLITNNRGEIKFSTKNIVPKSYNVKISFLGNDFYEKICITSKIVIKKLNSKIIAKQKTFKSKTKTKKYVVSIKDNFNKAIKKTKVILKVNGQTYKATTNKNGKATFKITKLNKKGSYKTTVLFKGNNYYNKASEKLKFKVK